MTKPTRPLKYPRWASKQVKDEISRQLNIYEPPEHKKDIGWVAGEPPPSQWLNWLSSSIHDWIAYLDHYLNRPKEYKKSELPSAIDHKGKIAFVSDIDGGVLSYSDGTKWRKIKVEGDI